MSSKNIRAGGAHVELSLRDKLSRQLTQIGRKFQSFGRGIQVAGTVIFAAGSAITSAFAGMVTQFAATGGALDDMAQRTRVPVETLSELGYVAGQTGSSIETLGAALFRMQRRVANAATKSGPAVRAMAQLGLNAAEVASMKVDKQFEVITAALRGVGDETLRAQYAFEIFGDQAQALLPMIETSAAETDKLRKRFQELGLEMSGKDAAAAAELGDSLGDLWAQLKRIGFEIGASIADEVRALVDYIKPVLRAVIDWTKANRPFVSMIAKAGVVLMGLGAAMAALGSALIAVVPLISTTSVILSGIGSGALVSGITAGLVVLLPFLKIIGLVLLGLAGLAFQLGLAAAAFYAFTKTFGLWEPIKNTFLAGLAFVKKVLGGVWAAIAKGNWRLAWDIFVTSIELALAKAEQVIASHPIGAMFVNTIKSVWGAAKMLWAALKEIWEVTKWVFSQMVQAVKNLWSEIRAFTTDAKAAIGQWIQGFRDAAGNMGGAAGIIMAHLKRVREMFSQVFGGIADALRAGDLALAARIAWEGVTFYFASALLQMKELWVEFKSYALGIWDALTTDLGSAWRDLTEMFVRLSLNAVKKMIGVFGQVTGIDLEGNVFGAALTSIDAALDELDKKRSNVFAAAIDRRRDSFDGELVAARNELAEAQAELDALTQQAKAGADAAAADRQRRLDDAQQRLDDLLKLAHAGDEGGADGRGAEAAGIADNLGSVIRENVGTFSAAGALAASYSSGPQDRMADGIEQMGGDVARLVKLAQQGRLVFQP